jgi:hypothetical protein
MLSPMNNLTASHIGWTNTHDFAGWYCHACGWKYPIPDFSERLKELTLEAWKSYGAHRCSQRQSSSLRVDKANPRRKAV